jgi:hypothetical protein
MEDTTEDTTISQKIICARCGEPRMTSDGIRGPMWTVLAGYDAPPRPRRTRTWPA